MTRALTIAELMSELIARSSQGPGFHDGFVIDDTFEPESAAMKGNTLQLIVVDELFHFREIPVTASRGPLYADVPIGFRNLFCEYHHIVPKLVKQADVPVNTGTSAGISLLIDILPG